MKYKKISLISPFLIATPLIVVSCGNDSSSQTNNYSVENDWAHLWNPDAINQSQRKDGIVMHWIDGDTVVVKFNGESTNTNIRIMNIDTPEINHSTPGSSVVDAPEQEWGEKATNLAKGLIPVGSPIRIVTSGAQSYNRTIGSVFYGTNFSKNLEIEMLKAGLAFPTMNAQAVKYEFEINYYIGHEIADAYNDALVNKRGIFSLKDIGSVIKTHGPTNTTEYSITSPNGIYAQWGATHGTK